VEDMMKKYYPEDKNTPKTHEERTHCEMIDDATQNSLVTAARIRSYKSVKNGDWQFLASLVKVDFLR